MVVVGKPDDAITFGDLADTYVKTVLKASSTYQRIDIVFDRYRGQTIKSSTRIRRSKEARPIRCIVEGRDVPLPKNWHNFLSLGDNKADLAHFLSVELCSQAPDNEEIVDGGGFKDELEGRSSEGLNHLTLKSTHEEADTRLILHAVQSQFKTVVVSSRDTDVLILLISHFQHMQCEHLWMMSGTSKKRSYIPINDVFNEIPKGSKASLLAFHAFTGSDTTSYITNHTKRSSWKVLEKHHELLKNVGIRELTEKTVTSSETFVCRIYNVFNTDSVDTARHLLFSKTGKPEALTPISDALKFHLMRVHYQSMVWRKAHCPILALPDASEMGWRLVSSELKPILMTLSPIPNSCLEMIACTMQNLTLQMP